MGNIAIVAVRLDALGEIEEHPEEFVKNMSACIQNPAIVDSTSVLVDMRMRPTSCHIDTPAIRFFTYSLEEQ